MNGNNPHDMTQIGTHRYRFWVLFEGTGDMLENHFTVPGNVPAAEADLIATAYWVQSVGGMVGGPAPRSMNAPKNAFTNTMANYAIQRANFEVIRPGEMV